MKSIYKTAADVMAMLAKIVVQEESDQRQDSEGICMTRDMKKKMKNKMVVMISWEKRGLQTIPPIGGNANANADPPSRANGLCHFSRRASRNALACPTRSVLIFCAYMSAKIF